jgi:cytochrome c oxidase cbb3-type subunit 3
MAEREIDIITGRETTGHEWDGIKELNTPLPTWWLYVFYFCIFISIVYMIFFPAWPLPGGGYTPGVLGWSSRDRLQSDLAAWREREAEWNSRIEQAPLAAIAADPDMLAVATVAGRSIFANNCAACHGTNGVGRPGGYPALVDDDWIWGGTLDNIHTTVVHGIRNTTDPEARISQMPAYGVDGLLTTAEISAVAEHVLFLAGLGADNAQGSQIYAENCAACHGPIGKGNPELGAPNLTDAIWLYGDGKAEIVAQIYRPRQGVMPPWTGRLTDAQLKEVTLYVYSLGGGQ